MKLKLTITLLLFFLYNTSSADGYFKYEDYADTVNKLDPLKRVHIQVNDSLYSFKQLDTITQPAYVSIRFNKYNIETCEYVSLSLANQVISRLLDVVYKNKNIKGIGIEESLPASVFNNYLIMHNNSFDNIIRLDIGGELYCWNPYEYDTGILRLSYFPNLKYLFSNSISSNIPEELYDLKKLTICKLNCKTIKETKDRIIRFPENKSLKMLILKLAGFNEITAPNDLQSNIEHLNVHLSLKYKGEEVKGEVVKVNFLHATPKLTTLVIGCSDTEEMKLYTNNKEKERFFQNINALTNLENLRLSTVDGAFTYFNSENYRYFGEHKYTNLTIHGDFMKVNNPSVFIANRSIEKVTVYDIGDAQSMPLLNYKDNLEYLRIESDILTQLFPEVHKLSSLKHLSLEISSGNAILLKDVKKLKQIESLFIKLSLKSTKLPVKAKDMKEVRKEGGKQNEIAERLRKNNYLWIVQQFLEMNNLKKLNVLFYRPTLEYKDEYYPIVKDLTLLMGNKLYNKLELGIFVDTKHILQAIDAFKYFSINKAHP